MPATEEMSKDTFSSEETFAHNHTLDKQYGISRVRTSIKIFEPVAEDNWPLTGPSMAKDYCAYYFE